MSARSRQDIQIPVSFLATCVKKPDKYNCEKLKRVLKYLKEMRELKLTLSVGDMSVVKWWLDASYVVQKYC